MALPQAKLNAIRNIILGKLSVKGSVLKKADIDALKVATNAYLFNGGTLDDTEVMRQILVQTINSRKFTNRSKVEEIFDIMLSLANEGHKLHLSRFRIRIKINKPMKDAIKQVEKQQEDLQLLQELDKAKTMMADFVNQLIDEQKQASDDYFSNYTPYKQQHNRRFDFEVKNQRKTTEQFNEELQPIYGDNLVCKEYINANTLAQMYCRKHDHHFSRMPLHLFKGYGCPHCNKEESKTWANTVTAKYDPSKRNDRWTTERFIQESINRFGVGVFDYSKVNYVNNDTRVTIIRLNDGKEMHVFPYEHLRRDEDYDGDPKHYEGKTNEEKIHYIVRLINEHLEHRVYMPYQDIPNSVKALRFVCPLHGSFTATTAQIKNGTCCPECDTTGESTGERNVRKYLIDHNIDYKQEYYIKDELYFPHHARVDFYLPNCKTLIEFQGEQHYGIKIRPKGMTKKTFQEQLQRDSNMRRYAYDHGLRLIEIPFLYRNSVAEFLDLYNLA